MKILNSIQIQAADAYTIDHEPIRSIDLMERAAAQCFDWVCEYVDSSLHLTFFCGPGNNGGDGLALARMLHSVAYSCSVYILTSEKYSTDFEINLKKLIAFNIPFEYIDSIDKLPHFEGEGLIIDALFGIGLRRSISGMTAQVIQYINDSALPVISVDIPSGLFADQAIHPDLPHVIKATHTLTFQSPKLSMLLPDTGSYCGELHILNIGLHQDYLNQAPSPYHFLETKEICSITNKRKQFDHKGIHGHALLIAGSAGMAGAAILATNAALRSGCGLVSVSSTEKNRIPIQVNCPEAIFINAGEENHINALPDLDKYAAVGVGPGIGTHAETINGLFDLLKKIKSPLVIDADAINGLSSIPDWWKYLPENAILTPHPGEFKRLFGETPNDFNRLDLLQTKALELKAIIVLKGAFTAIALPDGHIWFNSSGNPGMAKGGSGDVLTGLITGLLARGYSPENAVKIGVHLHGLAGDLAVENLTQEAIKSSDIIRFIPEAFKKIG